MKKPRLPTQEELAHWQEVNRETNVRKGASRGVVSVMNEDAAPRKKPMGAPDVSRATSPDIARRKPPLPSLPAREAKRAFKSFSAIEATLDLHGLGKLDAYARVQQFVMRAHCAGKRHVLIITGKGRAGDAGVLRTNLPHWLNEPALRALISAFAHARAEKGGHGVTHVLLKRS